jgi:hypothetical protein
MADLFSDDFEMAKFKWKEAKKNYEEAVKLFELIQSSLERHHKELQDTWREFSKQQSIFLKNPNIRTVNEEE